MRDVYEAKLIAFIRDHGIDCEHLVFERSTHSVEDAAAAAGATPEDFVKSICLLSKAGQVVVAIVKGEDRADRAAAQAQAGIGKLRLASPAEMLERTGYPAGGTPPFAFDAVFLVDERVLERPWVLAGGGSDRALIRVAPRELVRVSGARVARIRSTAAAA